MIFLIAIAVIVLYILILYNSFISKKNKIKQAASGIDVYLTQRFDLIPNLVECVKGYMIYEKETLEQITKGRTEYLRTKDLKEGEILNQQYNKIIIAAENYPDLKASEQFLNLQKSLSKIESQLQAARRIYNAEVNVYNNSIQMFPNSILANLCNFKPETYFEAEKEARNNIEVKNLSNEKEK